MAIWQYTFHVIPKESKEAYLANSQPNGFEDFDASLYWTDSVHVLSSFDAVEEILPEGRSWSKDIRLFGDQEGNCFEIGSDSNLIHSVSFRIDFRIPYEETLFQLVEFCILHGLIVVDEGLDLPPLNIQILKERITNSRQRMLYDKLLDAQNKADAVIPIRP